VIHFVQAIGMRRYVANDSVATFNLARLVLKLHSATSADDSTDHNHSEAHVRCVQCVLEHNFAGRLAIWHFYLQIALAYSVEDVIVCCGDMVSRNFAIGNESLTKW
jgi:hypothetical protein